MQLHYETFRPCRHKDRDPEWQEALPDEWRSAAIVPIDFCIHRDYEIPASRTLGYDEEMQPCYYRHTYILGSLRSDDDEEFYEAIAYDEDVQAWRLRDGRWLIRRIAHEEGGCRGDRGSYSFSECMPR
jgi:hypothetical protein